MLKTPEKADLIEAARNSNLLRLDDTKPNPDKTQAVGKKARPWAAVLRLSGSLTAILFVLLTTTYVGIYYCYPWKDLAAMEMPRWIIKFAEGLPDYIRGPERQPLVLLGSSLIIAPSSRLKDMHFSAPDKFGYRTPTPLADMYQKAIDLQSGRTDAPAIKILAVPGSVVSDQTLVLRELIASGKAPRMIVFTLAPRDFVDNEVGDKTSDTATARVISFLSHTQNFWPKSLMPAEIESCWSTHSNYFSLVRKHFSSTVKDEACTLSGHPKDLWTSAHTSKEKGQQAASEGFSKEAKEQKVNGDQVDPVAVARDLKVYKGRYQPHNQATFARQMAALEQLLALAKEARIATVLVEMPLSSANLALLTPNQKTLLATGIDNLAAKYDVEFVDYNKGPEAIFQTDDFFDSVHLDTKGAQKFVPLFARTISSSRAYKKTFSSQSISK